TGTSSYYPHSGGTDCGLDFDGDDDSVSISDHVDVKVKNNFSVAVWFTAFSLTAEGGDMRVLATKKDNSTKYYNLAFDEFGQLSGVVVIGGQTRGAQTGAAITVEKTHMAVMTYNNSAIRTTVYIDDTSVGTIGGTVLTLQPDTTLSVGRNGLTGEGSFLGKIYEFRVYDKTLSSTEVNTLFKGGHVSTNLKVYWKFDNCSGSTVTDRTTNAHNGTLNNSPAWETSLWSDQSVNLNVPASQDITA